MLNPSKEQVRAFFTDAWRKRRAGGVLTPLETMAADLVERHPEYHDDLQDPDAAERREEIARMLSGVEVTDEARAQAGRLLS